MVLRIFAIAFFVGLYSCTSQPELSSTEAKVPDLVDGKALFMNNCASCHGVDGILGMSGAKNLTETSLSDAEINKIITYGKKTMPAFKELIPTDEEIDAVVQHVRTLKKKE